MIQPPSNEDAAADAIEPACGWDQAAPRLDAPPASPFDYARLARFDTRIRVAVWLAALPFAALPVEYLCWPARFDASLVVVGGFLLFGLGMLALRNAGLRLGAYLLYVLYFVAEARLFRAPPVFPPLPTTFAALSALGGLGVVANLAATLWILQVERLPMPNELAGRIGRPFGSAKQLQRVFAIYRAAEEAGNNQAWKQQAGRQV